MATVGAAAGRGVFSVGARLAERRRRYGLHLWYEVRTDGRMPVAEVVQVFAALPAVAYAGFVYRAELAD